MAELVYRYLPSMASILSAQIEYETMILDTGLRAPYVQRFLLTEDEAKLDLDTLKAKYPCTLRETIKEKAKPTDGQQG